MLLKAGLVEVEREGRRVYRLSASVLEEALAYFMELREGGPREIPAHSPGPGG
ncbi:hypothetical protein TthSNM76_23280 (plasmid) [Thermus thermophilus]|nr:hypothetical protein TthSNM76_23280 [Thermus thermophilus]